ncbi:MAG: DUF2313 domain-containing protein [Desulfovibrio sp.]|jgi:uncharacterized protein YmfQ (DUF2313 family)|nr:DUF2313 domain-containing protein [Desulfovibrio sp.]
MRSLPASPHGGLLRALLPPVSYDTQADLIAVSCTADGLTLDRARDAALEVLRGLTPFADYGWMQDYERVYGLPNPCFVGPIDYDMRVVQLAIALKERAGISKEYYYWLAQVFGYDIDIQEFRPFVAGSKAGEILSNGDWQFVWIVHVKIYGTYLDIVHYEPFTAVSHAGDALTNWSWANVERLNGDIGRPFRAGRNVAGDYLRQWGDDFFECVFRRAAPAHTVLHFAYQ